MNYSAQTKQQLCTPVAGQDKRSLLSALLHSCGVLRRTSKGNELRLSTSNSDVTALAESLASELFESSIDITREGRDTVMSGDVVGMLVSLGIMSSKDGVLGFIEGIEPSLIDSDEKRLSYLKGAYLGAGNLSVGSWHLEITVGQESLARELSELIARIGISAHLIRRKERYAVYIKKQDDICDLIAYLGATKVMLALTELLTFGKVKRDALGKNNLELSNMDRTINVGVAQCEAIRKIEQDAGLDSLGEKLKEVAILRLSDSTMSYEEIARRLGISKGSVKYRFKKIVEAAGELPPKGGKEN